METHIKDLQFQYIQVMNNTLDMCYLAVKVADYREVDLIELPLPATFTEYREEVVSIARKTIQCIIGDTLMSTLEIMENLEKIKKEIMCNLPQAVLDQIVILEQQKETPISFYVEISRERENGCWIDETIKDAFYYRDSYQHISVTQVLKSGESICHTASLEMHPMNDSPFNERVLIDIATRLYNENAHGWNKYYSSHDFGRGFRYMLEDEYKKEYEKWRPYLRANEIRRRVFKLFEEQIKQDQSVEMEIEKNVEMEMEDQW